MNPKNLIIIIILAVVTIVFAVMWVNSSNKAKALEQEKLELKEAFENASNTIGEIQSSLNAIDQDLSGSLFTNKEIPGTTPEDRRTQLITSVSNMRKQIEADKKKIAELEQKLAQSGAQLKGVREMLDKLKASVADKDRIVAELQSELGILSKTLETERRESAAEIARRDKDISTKQMTIEEQLKDINTVFYVIGTRKELIEKKIIDRRGGLLGIGRVSTVSSNINVDEFTPLNLLEDDTITFAAPKKGYAVLTNQIATSYTVNKSGNENILTVTNPENFRKQKFIVIELM